MALDFLLRPFLHWQWRRREFPLNWEEIIQQQSNHGLKFYLNYSTDEHRRFRDLLKLFIWEKTWEGALGLRVSDEMKVLVSANAIRLIMGLDLSYYRHLHRIIIYPSAFRVPQKESEQEKSHWRLGEAHPWGTVVLSWDSVKEGLEDLEWGHNVVIHEFAHMLDIGDGHWDGTPRLQSPEHYPDWAKVMSHHYLRLQDGRTLQSRLLDPYGASNESEFFAVASEFFFERAEEMKQKLPDLYQLLSRFYRVDPAQP